MSSGVSISTAVVSLTVTVNVSLPSLPFASVAEHVTVVSPIGNVDPDAGAHAGVSGPSTMSLAVSPE